MRGQFEIYKDKSGKFRWRLTYMNGEVIASSGKSYPTRGNAIKALWNALNVINNTEQDSLPVSSPVSVETVPYRRINLERIECNKQYGAGFFAI